MCAINGFSFKDERLIRKMNEATRHRGPDGSGVFVDDDISLGHNLLAIVEKPERSGQPAVSSDGRFVLCYNGEIYNYRELREELKKGGENFYTDADTEVVLKGLAKEGESFLDRLDGMFAIAFYDKSKKQLLLVRDSAGMKPIYYTHETNRFIFSSEMRGIFCHGVSKRLNKETLSVFFSLGYVPGRATLFEKIFKVCPGEKLIFNLDSQKLDSSWLVARPGREDVSLFDPGKLRNLIGHSVNNHTMGLRPFGLYLSGGLDSTIILHELSTRRKEKVKTYTTRFETKVSRFNQDADYAAKLCQDYSIEHHELLVTEENFMTAFEETIRVMEEPRYNPSAAAYWLLSRLASKDIVVILNGGGGDELFGGYPRYLSSRILSSRYRRFPAPLLDFAYALKTGRSPLRLSGLLDRFVYLNEISLPAENRGIRFGKSFDTAAMVKYLKDMSYPALSKPLPDMENALAELDRVFWLADEEFLRTDKITMNFSMEGRFPFLAKSLIAYANALPSEEKLRDGKSKSVVRRAYSGILPEYIINKPKTGWNAPVTEWMHSSFGDYVKKVLSPDYYPPMAELFNFGELRKTVEETKEFTMSKLRVFMPAVAFLVWAKSNNLEL